MIWFWVVLLVLVVGAVAVVAVGRDNSMADAYEDRPDRTIPAGRPLTAADLQTVRFSSALRGYRMDEVDALIDRLASDLEQREHDAAAAAAQPDNTADTGTPIEATTGRRRAPTAAEEARPGDEPAPEEAGPGGEPAPAQDARSEDDQALAGHADDTGHGGRRRATQDTDTQPTS